MKIAVPREADAAETRAPMVPAVVQKLAQLGAEVSVEAGLGDSTYATDADYEAAGARVVGDRRTLLADAEVVLRLNPPAPEEVDLLAGGSIHISNLDPFFNQPLVQRLAERGVTALCMELIPRTTPAQKMDSLSSQASLGGYAAVMLAAGRLAKGFPMMMTPAGTLSPSRVFIIGAGVAGLQAIATAKRLGARVEAFDTRPVVEEQVKSLGAKFVKIDVGETGQTEGGYAKQLTAEQLEMQRKGMAKICAQSDVIVSTAKVFGRKPPLIISADMVAGMKPGSVIIDMAASAHGGNVAGSQADAEVSVNGVLVIGDDNLARRVPVHASQMYSSNLFNLLSHFWDADSKRVSIDRTDEIAAGAMVTHDGQIVSEMLRNAYSRQS